MWMYTVLSFWVCRQMFLVLMLLLIVFTWQQIAIDKILVNFTAAIQNPAGHNTNDKDHANFTLLGAWQSYEHCLARHWGYSQQGKKKKKISEEQQCSRHPPSSLHQRQKCLGRVHQCYSSTPELLGSFCLPPFQWPTEVGGVASEVASSYGTTWRMIQKLEFSNCIYMQNPDRNPSILPFPSNVGWKLSILKNQSPPSFLSFSRKKQRAEAYMAYI